MGDVRQAKLAGRTQATPIADLDPPPPPGVPETEAATRRARGLDAGAVALDDHIEDRVELDRRQGIDGKPLALASRQGPDADRRLAEEVDEGGQQDGP
jgi:hypothetical protein